MRLHSLLLGGIALSGQALAFSGKELQDGILGAGRTVMRRAADVEDMLEQQAHQILQERGFERRQAPSPSDVAPSPTTTPFSGDASKIDLKKWNEETESNCQDRLRGLGQLNNPTGMVVCYNLPFFDEEKGVFLSEVRLYQLQEPTEPWLGVQPENIKMTLSYLGAMLQRMEEPQRMGEPLSKRSVEFSADFSADITLHPFRDHALVARQDQGPVQPLNVLMYVGQINDNLMGPAMDLQQFQSLLVPTIELKSVDPTTQQEISTVLSSKEASFVNGVFADASGTVADSAASQSASAAALTATPVTVPGQTFGIFPVGFIVTTVWTLLFCATVGWGAFRKVQFREQFRRRRNRENAIWKTKTAF